MRKWISLMLCVLLLAPLSAAADESPAPFEDSQLRRMITLPTGKQMYYYAQNDPIWERARYEVWNSEGSRRTFGGGGCNPTSLAMIVANMVEESALDRIAQHTRDGQEILFCPGSVTRFYCANRAKDEMITPTQPEEYKKLLPLIFGNYACRNNEAFCAYRNSGGTSHLLFDAIAEIYGLKVTSTRVLDEALDALRGGAEVIILSGSTSQPFTQASGHYLVLGDADEEYLYLLDPYIVEKYTQDKKHVLEKIEGEPGLLRVERAMEEWLCVSHYYIFTVLTDAAENR